MLINNGAATTTSRISTLHLIADDSGAEDGDPSLPPVPGTPPNQLKMRLSNDPDFSGVAWQTFQPTVANWLLAPGPNHTATVYVEFMDSAGNVGDSGFAQSASVSVIPPVYMPRISR